MRAGSEREMTNYLLNTFLNSSNNSSSKPYVYNMISPVSSTSKSGKSKLAAKMHGNNAAPNSFITKTESGTFTKLKKRNNNTRRSLKQYEWLKLLLFQYDKINEYMQCVHVMGRILVFISARRNCQPTGYGDGFKLFKNVSLFSMCTVLLKAGFRVLCINMRKRMPL